MEAEIWKKIDGFDGYEISNHGNILSTKYNSKKLLSIRKNVIYPSVCLHADGKKYNRYIHRLVAEAYIPNPKNKPQVNHIDGNKKNNHKSNLEWVSNSENIKHAYKLGIKNPPRAQLGRFGKLHHLSKTIHQYSDNVLINVFESTREVERLTGFKQSVVSKCARGLIKKAYGFKWCYSK